MDNSLEGLEDFNGAGYPREEEVKKTKDFDGVYGYREEKIEDEQSLENS